MDIVLFCHKIFLERNYFKAYYLEKKMNAMRCQRCSPGISAGIVCSFLCVGLVTLQPTELLDARVHNFKCISYNELCCSSFYFSRYWKRPIFFHLLLFLQLLLPLLIASLPSVVRALFSVSFTFAIQAVYKTVPQTRWIGLCRIFCASLLHSGSYILRLMPSHLSVFSTQ